MQLTQQESPNDTLHVIKDLFVIPDGDDYLLYAPLSKSVLKVNNAVVQVLKNIKKGKQATDLSRPVVNQLYQVGILVDETNAHRQISFPEHNSTFDPKGLGLFLTTKCSMACRYCYADGGRSNKVMTWETAKTAIDWIIRHTLVSKRNEFYLMFHGGGEVTSVKNQFKQCVLYAREQAKINLLNLRIDAGLNGVMGLNLVDWITDHLDGATISLDGLPDIHNNNRPLLSGKESFDTVNRTLQRMDERNFRYGIRATVTPGSLHLLSDSISFMLSQYKTRSIQVEPVFIVGRALSNAVGAINPDDFIEQFRKSARLAKSHNVNLKYSGARFHSLTNQFCKVSNDSLSITSDGIATSCFEVAEVADTRSELFCYGKVNIERNTIDVDINKIGKLRTLSVEHKTHCDNCFCKWHCAGDCPAKQSLIGDPWNPVNSPRCHINRELTKDQIVDYLDEH